MATYNGHKNWNHWNVSLWLFNDEGLYSLLRSKVETSKRYGGGKDAAAEMLRVHLLDMGLTHTPDGAKYSFRAIRAAMRYMD